MFKIKIRNCIINYLNNTYFTKCMSSESSGQALQQSRLYHIINKSNHPFKKIPYKHSKKLLHKHFNFIPIYEDTYHPAFCLRDPNIINEKKYNVEHIWCKSWTTNKVLLNDMHNLFLADPVLNSKRQNHEFIDIKTQNKTKKFEPHEESKGMISRTLFYLLHQYPESTIEKFDSVVSPRGYLFEWFYKNKITKNEIIRNEFIGYIQGNINPFIKYPVLIPILYGEDIKSIIKCLPNTLFSVSYSLFIRILLKFV